MGGSMWWLRSPLRPAYQHPRSLESAEADGDSFTAAVTAAEIRRRIKDLW